MRNCDGCTVCCWILNVQDTGISKPPRQFCQHLKDTPPQFTLRSNNKEEWKKYNSGCSIHTAKFGICYKYMCDWVKGFGEEKDKPKLSGLLFDNNRFLEVWKGAATTLEGQKTIQRMMNATKKDYTQVIGRHFPIEGKKYEHKV